ncbi:MAG: retropepsin-like domain-containing protein [Candidatus Rokubacteria bacterium]|nr:retropepsin-like domain-containing protein [Candidatus Rokubacteria bacterium]
MKFPYYKFSTRDPNRPFVARPYIPVYLATDSRRTESPYLALLDSGSDTVMFPTEVATKIGIDDIRKGHFAPSIGIAGQTADVYYHDVFVQVLGDATPVPVQVGFSDTVVVPILGRSFFRHYRVVVFAEAKEEVELRS